MSLIVTIIIPVYRDWAKLETCLHALHNQSYSQDNYEIIIVNNEPDASVLFDMSKFPKAVLIHEPKPGSYAARNAGLKAAKGEIIGFTDSDCTPDKDWIKNAVNYLNQHKNISRLAGPVEIIQKAVEPTILEKYNMLYAFPQVWLINNGGGSVTANLFAYKTIFDVIGGFNDKLMSMEDKMWGMKAEAAGFRIAYVENVLVRHPSRNLKELIKKEKRHAGALVNGTTKHPSILYLELIYDARPRISGLRFMFGKSKDRSLLERLTIPFLRHYLLLRRKYEIIQIYLGKKNSSRV